MCVCVCLGEYGVVAEGRGEGGEVGVLQSSSHTNSPPTLISVHTKVVLSFLFSF